MQIRKTSFLIIVLTLSVTMIFAGGSSDSSTRSIDVWRITNPDENIMVAFEQAAIDFEEETGIHVNYILSPTNDFHSRLVTSVSAGIYPDVIIWNSSPGIEFSQTGMVVPMNDLIEEVGTDQFGESVLKMFSIDGVLYEAPFLIRPGGLHGRRDWLEAAGYDLTLKEDENGRLYIEDLQTYEDLLEAGIAITDAANGKYGLGFGHSRMAFGDSASYVFTILAAYGARILDDDGNIAIDSAETRAALDYLIRVWESGAVPPAATTWDGNSNNQFFISGDIGMVINSNSIMARLDETTGCRPEDLIIIPMPAGPAGAFMSGSPESITIFNTSKVEESQEFAKFLLRNDTQLKMFETMGFSYYAPLKADIISDPMFDNLSDNEKVLINGGDSYISTSYPGEPDARLSQLFSSFFYDDILSHIAIDGYDVEQLIDYMVSTATERLFD